jgi:uncharacterized membrane protein (UPF0182 family)
MQLSNSEQMKKAGSNATETLFKGYENIPKLSKRTVRIIVAIVVLLLLLLGALFAAIAVVPDLLWYSNLGYINVLWVKYFAPVIVFAIGFVIVATLSWLSLYIVFKSRAAYAVAHLSVSEVEKLKSTIAKHKNKWFAIISIVIGALYGLALTGSTGDFLLFFGNNSFGQVDPIFHNDISFYTFVMPCVSAIISSLTVVFVITFFIALVAGLIFGQATTISRTFKFGKMSVLRVAKPLRIQLSLHAALVTLFISAATWFSQYDLLTNINDRITGATWTDVNVRIPVIQLTTALLVVIAFLFVITAFAGKVRIPLIGIGATVLIAVVASTLIPSVVQNFKVTPNAQELEREYIGYNMEATKTAFGIDDVDIKPYNAVTETKPGQLMEDAETTAQIRLLDPQIVAPTYRQLQQNRQYYGFQDMLSVDKYNIDGKLYDTVISARELDLTGNSERNWVNDHTVYTHGYGLVAGYGNQVTDDGRPKFFEKDIPTSGELTTFANYEPRIYFSTHSPEYSIVGAPNGQAWEFDHPESAEKVTFSGNGGPNISNPFVKLIYALRFQDYNLFFSDRINSESQILYTRDPEERVKKVAPYLELDGRVYPAAVDGRIKWILDAYTTTSRYPYSAQIDLGSVTRDALTETSRSLSALSSGYANYIRNSVKVTVDAYDGSVTLYTWDAEDPVLKAWAKIYGQNLHNISEISGDLMAHIRYPENLFKIQRSLLSKYHVNSASSFFSGEDFWQVPGDPTVAATTAAGASGTATTTNVKQPPYYLTLQMPDQDRPVFSLTSSFIPGGGAKREILTGFLSADSDAGNQAGVVGENYGKLHLLELPRNTTVPGPGQAQNNFNANADVSKELNLLSGNSSSIKRGNLLTLPLGGGLIYVQPVYVQSTGNTSFPLLKKILVAFGDKVGFDSTLQGALNQVFGGNSGANLTETTPETPAEPASPSSGGGNSGGTAEPGEPGASPDSGTNPNDGNTSSDALKQAQQALENAKRAIEEAQKALDAAK